MDIGHILTSSPTIIECIFHYLSARDLCSSAQVCTVWNRMAESEKNRRKHIVWFFKVGSTDENDHSPCESCPLTPADKMKAELHAQMDQNKTHPAFCMAFVTSQLLDTFGDFFPAIKPCGPNLKKLKMNENTKRRKYLQSAIRVSLKPFLPSQCPVTFTVAPGIIGCLPNGVPLEIEDGPAISGFLLPKFPGVEMHHFPVTDKYSNLGDMVAEKSPVKCLLIFISLRGMTFTNKLIQSCLSNEDCQVAIGGAIVERTECLMGSVVAFSGDKVRAASIVINSRHQKDIESKLEIFRTSGLVNRGRCFAYMFACVARGFYLYHERHVESSIFRKMYSGVPLVGIFGNGEIGVNYAPNLPVEQNYILFGRLRRYMKKFLYSNTTVFVMISIDD